MPLQRSACVHPGRCHNGPRPTAMALPAAPASVIASAVTAGAWSSQFDNSASTIDTASAQQQRGWIHVSIMIMFLVRVWCECVLWVGVVSVTRVLNMISLFQEHVNANDCPPSFKPHRMTQFYCSIHHEDFVTLKTYLCSLLLRAITPPPDRVMQIKWPETHQIYHYLIN